MLGVPGLRAGRRSKASCATTSGLEGRCADCNRHRHEPASPGGVSSRILNETRPSSSLVAFRRTSSRRRLGNPRTGAQGLWPRIESAVETATRRKDTG